MPDCMALRSPAAADAVGADARDIQPSLRERVTA
jgi:hypothetical protein